MYKYEYSSTVKCYDGIIRTFVHGKLFSDHRAFQICLAQWDGHQGPLKEPYRYFETDEQRLANLTAKEFLGPFSTLDFVHEGIHGGYFVRDLSHEPNCV